MNNEEFVVYQYDDEGKRISITTLKFKKPKSSDYTFDVYAGFKVSPDTCSIQLERFALDNWGRIRPIYNSRVRVPFCGKDFFYLHKVNRMIYLCVTFCGRRVIYDYQYGTLKCPKQLDDTNKNYFPSFNISDIPREYRDALL